MPKTILVVEDERPLMAVISKKLELSGFVVRSARSVQDARDLLEKGEKIDGIWLDHYLLGKETGLDFVARLRNGNEQQKHIPIFVVSNTASPDKVRTYLELGATKYYTKSDFRLEEIIRNIHAAIKA